MQKQEESFLSKQNFSQCQHVEFLTRPHYAPPQTTKQIYQFHFHGFVFFPMQLSLHFCPVFNSSDDNNYCIPCQTPWGIRGQHWQSSHQRISKYSCLYILSLWMISPPCWCSGTVLEIKLNCNCKYLKSCYELC